MSFGVKAALGKACVPMVKCGVCPQAMACPVGSATVKAIAAGTKAAPVVSTVGKIAGNAPTLTAGKVGVGAAAKTIAISGGTSYTGATAAGTSLLGWVAAAIGLGSAGVYNATDSNPPVPSAKETQIIGTVKESLGEGFATQLVITGDETGDSLLQQLGSIKPSRLKEKVKIDRIIRHHKSPELAAQELAKNQENLEKLMQNSSRAALGTTPNEGLPRGARTALAT